MTKILSVEDLIKNKVKIEKSDDKEINLTLAVPSVGGGVKLTFTKNDVIDFQEAMANVDVDLPKNEREKQYGEAGYHLVYTVISEPNLKDKQLQEAYECEEPTDILKKIFDEGEITDIMNFVVDKSGLKGGKVIEVKDLKN